jgi:hypothetical protein
MEFVLLGFVLGALVVLGLPALIGRLSDSEELREIFSKWEV